MPIKTHIGPIQLTFNSGLPTEFVINREHQLEDATLTITDMFAEHMTQESEAPADKSFTGLEASFELSLADIGFDFFRRATNPARYTIDTATPTKRKLEYGDLTGLRVPKFKILIKPYAGFLPTTNTDDWYTFLNCGIETEAALSFGKTTQSAYTMRGTAYADDVTRMKVIRGDTTATGTATGLAVAPAA